MGLLQSYDHDPWLIFHSFYRYLWFVIRLLARAAYRPIPLPQSPTYVANEDVTIIVPTIDAGEEFRGERGG